MAIKLNWSLQKIPLVKILKPDILLALLTSCIWFHSNAQEDSTSISHAFDALDTIVAKTTKIIIEEDTLPVYSFSIGNVGTTFPCGNRFGISLQAPGYHIFSAESAYNATFVPEGDDIQWPDEGAGKNNMAYKKSFDRIRGLKVGEVEGSFGKRWTISSEQFKANYSNMFDIELNGQKRLAGDYSNMFFEMLISIQELANENEQLKEKLENTEERLTAIEAQLNLMQPSFIRENLTNELKISPNPSDSDFLNIEYSINGNVGNASLNVFDLDGKLHYQTSISQRGKGNFAQSFNFAAGVYFYQLVTDGNKSETEKLIIN